MKSIAYLTYLPYARQKKFVIPQSGKNDAKQTAKKIIPTLSPPFTLPRPKARYVQYVSCLRKHFHRELWIIVYMICISHSGQLFTTTRITIPSLIPRATAQHRSTGTSTARRNMATLKREVPNLKLNDGTSVPMVSTPLSFNLQDVDGSL